MEIVRDSILSFLSIGFLLFFAEYTSVAGLQRFTLRYKLDRKDCNSNTLATTCSRFKSGSLRYTTNYAATKSYNRTLTNTRATSPNDDVITQWGVDNGVIFNKVAVCTFNLSHVNGYRGIIALNDILSGEDFLSVPLRLALMTDSLGRLSLSNHSWQSHLVVKLLQAKESNVTTNGFNSFYINKVLPTLESFRSSLPIFWHQSAKELIEDDRIAEAIDSSLRGHEFLREEVREILTRTSTSTIMDDDTIDWAIGNVRTRNCRLNFPNDDISATPTNLDFNALVPIFDLLNHSGYIRSRFRLVQINGIWYINVCYDHPFHIKRGEQVFLNYGNPSDEDERLGNFLAEEMLVQYGFIPYEESIETGSVDIFLPRKVTLKYLMLKLSVDQHDDAVFDSSLAVLERLRDAGITMSQEFNVYSHEISADLMFTVRLLTCKNPSDFQSFDKISRDLHRLDRGQQNFNIIVSLTHELESISMLKDLIQDRLSALPDNRHNSFCKLPPGLKDYLLVQQGILRNAMQLIDSHRRSISRYQQTSTGLF